MRKIIIGLITLIAVTACSSNPHSNRARISRSELVKTCKDGTWIGFDPQDRVYVAMKQSEGFLGSTWHATLGSDIDPESVCS